MFEIPLADATARHERFVSIKKQALKKATGVEPDDFIPMPPADFLELLKTAVRFSNNKPDPVLTGLKLYLAFNDPDYPGAAERIPPGKDNMLTFVLLPTIDKNGTEMYDLRATDREALLLTKKDKSFYVEKGMASAWVQKYQTTYVPTINDIHESTALWYPIKTIVEIIIAVEAGIQNGTYQEMLFWFGAYGPKETIEVSLNGSLVELDIRDQLTVTFLCGKDLTGYGDPLRDDPPNAYDTTIPIPPASPDDPDLP